MSPFLSNWDHPSSSDFRTLSLAPSLALLLLPLLASFGPRLSPFLPSSLRRVLIDIFSSYISPYVTLKDVYSEVDLIKPERTRWKTVVLSLLSFVQLGLLAAIAPTANTSSTWITFGLLACCWAFATVHPLVVRRTTAASFPLLSFLLVQLATSLFVLLSPSYHRNFDPTFPLLSSHTLVLEIFVMATSLCLIAVNLSLKVVDAPVSYLAEHQRLISEGDKGFSLEDRSTVASWLTFAWMDPVIALGRRGYVNESDLWKISPTQAARVLFPKFDAMSHLSTVRRVIKANGADFFLDFYLSYIAVALAYVPPYLLKQILDAIEDPTPHKITRAYALAGAAFVVNLVKVQLDLNKRTFGRRASNRAYSEISSAMFQKALLRKDASGVGAGGAAGVGKIVQLMSSDAPRVANIDISRLYNAPLEIIVCCTFLFTIISWSAFAGVATILLLQPLQTRLTQLSFKLQSQYRKSSDERTSLISELVSSIKHIKFFAWEQRWLDKIDEARAKELKLMAKGNLIELVFGLSGSLAPLIVTGVTFFCYVYIEGKELTVSVAFVSLSLFAMLRGPLTNIPLFVVEVSRLLVAAHRIDAFLAEDEIDPYISSLVPSTASPSALRSTGIGFVAARFKWNSGTAIAESKQTTATDFPRVFELGPIDFLFPVGALTIISGPTGGGKTALLLSLLGETTRQAGSILLPKDATRRDESGLSDSVAYAGQTAWLEDLSIKQNILFGSPHESTRYDAVLEACALLPDLAVLEDGDDTEIGSRGVSLSGGQKARVALARAVYSSAKHLLLDDPLAAVDAHTASNLVSDCLASPLLKDRTIIIVSHHVELLLPIAHSVLHVVDGRIEAQGTVAELRESGHLSTIVAQEEKAHFQKEIVAEGGGEKTDEVEKVKKVARVMTAVEDKATGRVTSSTYMLYLSAVSWPIVLAVFALMLFSDNAPLFERWWIAIWTRPVEESIPTLLNLLNSTSETQAQYPFSTSTSSPSSIGTSFASRLPVAKDHPLFYLGVYMAISLAFIVITLVEDLVAYFGKYRASQKLHARLLRSVMRATPRWFDVTPSGRLSNRFIKDIGTIDTYMLTLIMKVTHAVVGIGGSLLLIFSLLPAFLIPAAFIALAFYLITIQFLRVSRDLARIKSVSMSPVFQAFESGLAGIVTIRAFSAEKMFMEQFFDLFDACMNAEWLAWMTNRWLLARFDTLGGIAVFACTVLVLYSRTSAGLGGMMILASQGFTQTLFWLARWTSSMEQNMNSVERVKEYLDIPQEAKLLVSETTPPAYWPSQNGETLISVKDLVVSYDPALPPVLHGVSFDVKPREKIGLIGRTGSGKSTLGMALLRFTEFTSGSVTIDGLDISKIGLQNLREKVSIIPQDAVLFRGTIRSNLDPFQEHSDEELNDALQRVQLGTSPSRAASSSRLFNLEEDQVTIGAESGSSGKIAITLDSEVHAGGLNFSQGQRQLIALGRALLRNNPIVIMDEATASVDMDTDLLIQQTIREQFVDSCLLTIAHRLSSIKDYDRLVVLDAGRIVEIGTPSELLANPKGVFRGLAEKSGQLEELLESTMGRGK